jgi:Spy/CpxP family protein refolding chaperone
MTRHANRTRTTRKGKAVAGMFVATALVFAAATAASAGGHSNGGGGHSQDIEGGATGPPNEL